MFWSALPVHCLFRRALFDASFLTHFVENSLTMAFKIPSRRNKDSFFGPSVSFPDKAESLEAVKVRLQSLELLLGPWLALLASEQNVSLMPVPCSAARFHWAFKCYCSSETSLFQHLIVLVICFNICIGNKGVFSKSLWSEKTWILWCQYYEPSQKWKSVCECVCVYIQYIPVRLAHTSTSFLAVNLSIVCA